MPDGHLVGLIANPASARDIRRLVADGAPVTTHQKLNIIKRLLAGLASTDVDRVVSMTDLGGISGGLEGLAGGPAGEIWPAIDFVDHPLTKTAADTTAAVDAMVQAGVEAIVVLGGDGTNRIVAERCDDIPIASISTGTNNAFARTDEPTVVGIAAGLIATGVVPVAEGTRRSKALSVVYGTRHERALVDVALTDHDAVGSGSVWDPRRIHELFLCFAEPDAIGLSSIGAHVGPVDRDAPTGLHLRLGKPVVARVQAPIAPGLVVEVGIAAADELRPGESVAVDTRRGVVAIDGERVFRVGDGDRVTVTLDPAGPLAIDVAGTMRFASCAGVLARDLVPLGRPIDRTSRSNRGGLP